MVEIKMETTSIGAIIGLGFLKQIKTSAHQHTYFICKKKKKKRTCTEQRHFVICSLRRLFLSLSSSHLTLTFGVVQI
jgi:hypothetical protein